MKQIVLCIFAVLFICSSVLKSDIGLGVIAGEPTNVALSFRVNRFPVIGLGWNFNDNGFVTANIDFWAMYNKFEKTFAWYVGPGANIYLPIKSENKLGVGLRVVGGIQWIPLKNFEFFGELAPSLQFTPESDFDTQFGIGVRYLF